jgi:hypothetical protein
VNNSFEFEREASYGTRGARHKPALAIPSRANLLLLLLLPSARPIFMIQISSPPRSIFSPLSTCSLTASLSQEPPRDSVSPIAPRLDTSKSTTMASTIIATANSSMNYITDHPYYPLEVEIASYLANEWSVPVLLGIFAALCATIIFGTKYVVNNLHPNLPGTEKAAIWWFVICTSLFDLSVATVTANNSQLGQFTCFSKVRTYHRSISGFYIGHPYRERKSTVLI